MPKVIADISMSLDGFVTGNGADDRHGLGDAPELHTWVMQQDAVDTEMLEQSTAQSGAVVMGRRLFDVVNGPDGWNDEMGYGADQLPREHTGRVQILSERESRLENIATYESHGTSAVRLADGHGEAHAYQLLFEAGGAIGRHEAGYGQLLIVVTGRGWVSGNDGARVEVGAGDVILFDRGELHAKGSDTGMTAVMVQVREWRRTHAPL